MASPLNDFKLLGAAFMPIFLILFFKDLRKKLISVISK